MNFLTFLESSMPGHLSLQKGSPICVSYPKILAKGREYPAKNINKVLYKLQNFMNVCILKTGVKKIFFLHIIINHNFSYLQEKICASTLTSMCMNWAFISPIKYPIMLSSATFSIVRNIFPYFFWPALRLFLLLKLDKIGKLVQ